MAGFLQQRLHVLHEAWTLRRIPRLTCSGAALRKITRDDLDAVFGDAAIAREWSEVEDELARACAIDDGKTAGVNPGDRRAIWYLAQGLGAESVLEIGTHVGASTVHLASALRGNARRDPTRESRLVTVDVHDVNDATTAFWRKFGLRQSPRQMIASIGCGDFTTFVTEPSLTYLDRCDECFDLIFLDGNHYATTVYQELPRALNRLNAGGVVLLHDYFPENRPLWMNGSLVAGPYIATSRLRREGGDISVVPLGDLPWPTKQGSHRTSLALVSRRTA